MESWGNLGSIEVKIISKKLQDQNNFATKNENNFILFSENVYLGFSNVFKILLKNQTFDLHPGNSKKKVHWKS